MAKQPKPPDVSPDVEDFEGTDLPEMTEDEAVAAIEAHRIVPADVAETFCQKILSDQFDSLPLAVAERLRAAMAHRGRL